MAKEFCQRGIASAAVYSGENGAYAEERNEAIRKLKNGEIRVMIECSILYNLKRYTFRRNERITFEDESLNKVLENLKAFLEKHSSKDKEESEK